tara:strand:- start:193 stop:546 length:354 start_codon:yes stop_codon:yes gene_type:complete
MNISLERVTDFFKPFLLQDIVIKTNKKVLKKGRFKIFQVKQYYINLTLEINGVNKNYEIPYPFKVDYEDNIGILNYHLSSFIPHRQMTRVKFLDSSSKSKLYDNLVYILPSDGTNLK